MPSPTTTPEPSPCSLRSRCSPLGGPKKNRKKGSSIPGPPIRFFATRVEEMLTTLGITRSTTSAMEVGFCPWAATRASDGVGKGSSGDGFAASEDCGAPDCAGGAPDGARWHEAVNNRRDTSQDLV